MPGMSIGQDQPRDALVLRRVGIGAHEELADVGDLAERAPDLLARSARSRRRRASARVRSDARSEPAPGSENPWHHTSSPRRIFGRCAAFCSSVPSSISVGPACSVPTKFTPTYGRAGPGGLLVEDQLLGRRRAPAAVLLGPVQARVARVEQPPLPVGVPLAALVPRVARRAAARARAASRRASARSSARNASSASE